MRRWLRTGEAARLIETPTNTFRDAIDRGDYAGVLTKKVGKETRWCAEALWKAHVQGDDSGCMELAEIQAFVAEYPLPADAPGESRLAS